MNSALQCEVLNELHVDILDYIERGLAKTMTWIHVNRSFGKETRQDLVEGV